MSGNCLNFIGSDVHKAQADSEKPGKRVGVFFNIFAMKELERVELANINGGTIKWWEAAKKGIWFGIALTIIENWADIKSGTVDGWNDAMKEK